MIKSFYEDDIVKILSSLISYGLDNLYSPTSIEEHIASSFFINGLEHNEYDIETKIEDAVGTSYKKKIDSPIDISYGALFLGESYLRLFFDLNKSFEYLFLYWPISFFLERYDIYHEMDFSNLKNDFLSEIKRKPLLKALSEKRGVKLVDISRLTGISENTIDRYVRDDGYLYAASYVNVYRLSRLLDVKENVFASSLGVYLDSSAYLSYAGNDDCRNYLGMLFASYFDKRVDENSLTYDRHGNCFLFKDGKKLIVRNVSSMPITEDIVSSLTDDIYLVLLPYGLPLSHSDLEMLKQYGCYETLILNRDYAYLLKKGSKKEITDVVFKSLFIRAKEKVAALKLDGPSL